MGLSLSKSLNPLHKKSSVHRHNGWPTELTRHVITSNNKIQPFRLLATELCHDDSVRPVASCSHHVLVLAVPTATHSEQAPEWPQEAAGERGEDTGWGRSGPGLGVGEAGNVDSGDLEGAMWPGKAYAHEATGGVTIPRVDEVITLSRKKDVQVACPVPGDLLQSDDCTLCSFCLQLGQDLLQAFLLVQMHGRVGL